MQKYGGISFLSKLFAFRTNNPKIISFMETKALKNAYLKGLVEKDMKGGIISDSQRLKDLNLTLDIYKKLKELGIILPKINDPFDVITGKEKLEVPSLELLNNGQTIKSDLNQCFLDVKNYCSKCNHTHIGYNKQCSRWDCDCEVRC